MEQRREVRQHLLDGKTPAEAALAASVSSGSAFYLREKLYMEGLLQRPAPAAGLNRQNAGGRIRKSRAGQDSAPAFGAALCLVDGCYERTHQKFCPQHDTAAMIAAATAGMSEATRRKLTGSR
jgi:hypothetical protein